MSPHCTADQLQSALAGNLPADEETLLHRHLESCDQCSSAIEQLAGGDAWSRQAAALLQTDEFDVDLPPREEFSEIDFTVEHLDPSDDPAALGQLGGYDILEVIGRGGHGVVLKAYDRALKRCVAVKVLAPHLAQSSLAKKRFAREAQAAAAVVHANVLAIHQVQPTGRLPFLVMPLVAGESLAHRLAAKGSLELTEVLRIGMQAAAGLAAAHEQGLVHRDVKPANILLEKGVERAVLTDFGLARAADDVALTRWGIIAGTPQYMSPEQARGEPVDGRSDLFSLGCVLYEMATGVSPFRTDSTMATLRKLIDEPPQSLASHNPELPPWFVAIVEKLLEKDPAKRFNSAKEVSEFLEGCLAHLQQPGSVPLPPGLPAAATKPRGKWSLPRWIATIATAILLIGGGITAFMVATAEPSDISGDWDGGEEWGRIELKQITPTQYVGAYSRPGKNTADHLSEYYQNNDHVGHLTNPGNSIPIRLTDIEKLDPEVRRHIEQVIKQSGGSIGKIELAWSRIERQYTGTWSEGKDRFGDIAVRLVDNEIRGAYTTSRKAKVNPATPKLADLKWSRYGPPTPADAEKAARLSAEGWQLWSGRNLDQAATKFEQAVKLDPTNADAWSGLGWSTWQSGNSHRAVEAFNKAIKLEPKHPGALNGLGQLYLADRQDEKAEKFLIEAAPAATAAWYGLARLYLLQGKFGDAEKWAQKIVDSGDTEAQQLLDAAKTKQLPPELRPLIEPAKTNVPDKQKAPGADASSTVNVPTDAEKQVIQAKLNQAQAEFAIVEANYKAEQVSTYDYQVAKDKVEILKAELTGNPVLVAQVKLDSAKRKLEIMTEAHKSELISNLEFEKAKGEVAIAEAELRKQQEGIQKTPNSNVASRKAASTSTSLEFGPTIERTVNDDNEPGGHLIDLDTGKLFSWPKQRTSFEASLKWTRDAGIDALGEMHPGIPRLVGYDLIAIPVESTQWDCAPEFLLARLAGEKLILPDPKDFLEHGTTEMSASPKNPLPTYFIQTREGGKGILQITNGVYDPNSSPTRKKPMPAATPKNSRGGDDADTAEKPIGIKIRYKLLKVGDTGANFPLQTETAVLRAKLQQAQTELERIKTLYNAKAATTAEYETAADAVAILTAQRDGNDLRVAEIRLAAARRNLDRTKKLADAKSIPAAELEKSQSDLAIAESELQAQQAKLKASANTPLQIYLIAADDGSLALSRILLGDRALKNVDKLRQELAKITEHQATKSDSTDPIAVNLHVDKLSFDSVQQVMSVISQAGMRCNLSKLSELEKRKLKLSSDVSNAHATGNAADSSREVLKAKLQEAQANLNRLKPLAEAQQVPSSQYENAKQAVALLEAELEGGPIRVAEVRLQSARQYLSRIEKLAKNRELPAAALEEAKSRVAAAEAEMARAQTESKPNATQQNRFDMPPPKRIQKFNTAEQVHYLAYSADGKLLAVANGNPSFTYADGKSTVADGWKPFVEILDAETGKQIVKLNLHSADDPATDDTPPRTVPFIIKAIAFSPNAEFLAVGNNGGQVKLFNSRTGELVRELNNEQGVLADNDLPEYLKLATRANGMIESLAFSPDGSQLAVCGRSIADINSRRSTYDGRRRSGFRNADAANSAKVGVSYTGSGRLQIWDLKTGTIKHDLAGHSSRAECVQFSPDGKFLASAGRWDDGHQHSGTGAIVWDLQTAEKISTIPIKVSEVTSSVVFSPDGSMLAIGSQDAKKGNDLHTTDITLAHALTGVVQWKQTIPGWANLKAFTPDGKNVVVRTGKRIIRFFDAETGLVTQEIGSIDDPDDGWWSNFAIAPEANRLAVGGTDNEGNGTVEIWDLSDRTNKSPTSGDSGKLTHQVRFEIGATLLENGDRITIEEVRGTADTMKAINAYEVKGTYRLASRDKATLYSGVAGDGDEVGMVLWEGRWVDPNDPQTPKRREPIKLTPRMEIVNGEGRFTLSFSMNHNGKPHISFYPETGRAFAHVYFGTGNSVLKKGWWEKDDAGKQSKKSAEWREKLLRLINHNQTAFAIGPQLIFELPATDAFEVVRDCWPKITIDEVKTGLLKTFEFARHERVLEVLNLGAQDQSEEVRNYAYSYLQNYALRDFKLPANEYSVWWSQQAGQPVEKVLESNARWLVKTLRESKPTDDEQWWNNLDDMLNLTGNKTSYPSKAKYLREAGLPEVLQKWSDEENASDVVKHHAKAIISALKEPAPAKALDKAEDLPVPKILKCVPEPGALNIDSNLKEISVTFDRDMDKGMSWTGSPPLFPPADKDSKPKWLDARTCVLPVKLQQGSYYRVGINSTSHQNFRSADGKPAFPSAIYFSTQVATDEIQSRCQRPEIVKLEPANGANDVDPNTETLKATFNMPMNPGISFTGSGPNYPKSPAGKTATWSADALTCTLPVALEPGHEYELGLNDPHHINFQSQWGVPLTPVTYKFTTAAQPAQNVNP